MNLLRKSLAAALAVALQAPPAASAAEAAKAALATGIEVLGDTVHVETAPNVEFDAFTTSNPPRLVIDLQNTQNKIKDKVHEGFGGVHVKQVRTGQFQDEPEKITRVVIDLAAVAPYAIDRSPTGLDVRLSPVGTSSKLRDAPAMQAIEAEKEGVPLSAAVPLKSDDYKDGPAGQVDGSRRGDSSVDILDNLPKTVETFDFDDAELGDVLRLMAARIGVNIIYGSDVTGVVNLHLTDVPFDEAFHTVLKLHGLTAVQRGNNILRIVKPATLNQERTLEIATTKIIPLNYAKAAEFGPEVQAVAAAEGHQIKVNTNKSNNALIITATPDGLLSAQRLIDKLDVRPAQVLIETKLIEVQLSKDFNLGIQWDYFSQDTGRAFGKNGISTIGSGLQATATPPTVPFNSAAQPIDYQAGGGGRGTGVSLPSSLSFGALTLGRVTENYFLNVTLSAAASKGKAKVLSDPKIATLNNETAQINVETQIPYATSDATANGVISTNVNYLNVGISLKVTPTVNADGRITLKINPQVSQPSATTAAVAGAPGIDTRSADTLIMVRDGETIVIGGLISDRMTEDIAKVPLLGDIPIAGWLFKKKSVTRQRQELLIFVTTKVLED